MRGAESLSRNADPYRRPHRQSKKKHCRDAESSSAPKRGSSSLSTQSGLRVLPLFAFADDGWMDGCRGKKETASVHHSHRRSRASNFTRPFSHTVRGKKSVFERRREVVAASCFMARLSLLLPSPPFPLCGMLVLLGKTTLSSS